MLHHTKINQEGTRPKDPRHVYGNPFAPATCWMTAWQIADPDRRRMPYKKRRHR
ncbi:TPA: hypothetical protein N0F65_004187 [Lagenidium giganteum]|uniref:Uncharacterized protein n=1 Tax=Lagenidium giganteum TaxID=4803 RepID=A0AAV2YKZ2_9STRA|nr:TPA: hypothetical protein N0F65_004187 [Lagenidium giganteum]